MLRIAIVLLAATQLAMTRPGQRLSDPQQPATSNLKADESLVFFRTAGWLDEANEEWHLPIHGWVYEPEDSRGRQALATRVLSEQYDLHVAPENDSIYSARLNWLLADNERGKDVYIRLGSKDHVMPRTGPDGHFSTTLVIAAADAQAMAIDGRITYSAVTSGAVPRSFSGTVQLVRPAGITVISDIDDTVKISHVTDRRKLLDYTLFREFEATPGMPKKYQAWLQLGADIQFVSSSPWQLYAPLANFAEREGMRATSFHLKAVRFRDETIVNLFKKGTDTKPAQIKPILERFPDRRFVLVGDTGEHDPEVYAELMRSYPQQVVRVFLRNVTNATADDPRFQKVFHGIADDRWSLFTDPADLDLPTN